MRLQHPNVAPLIGFTFDGEVAIISPWFSHGNILDYLNERPEVDRGKLLQGVADGVLYLHSSNPVIVHGDLKPDNVLIDQCGIPRIIDFGLSKLLEEEPHLSPALSTSLREAGNARWVAPELLLEENASRSLKTDIFSLGCVAFFILTGDVPFKSTPDGQLVIARYKGAYPIPEAASYPDLNAKTLLMGALRSCWNTNPGDRPFIGYVVHRLKNDELGILDQAALSNEVLETVPQSSASRLVEQSTSISSPFRPWSAIKSMWKSFKAFLHNFFKSKPGDS
ncbi:hypothetical protein M407DRAFT_232670 [Tulasnella calospora MUT 4182]|uniref:Protein kinase domain-containing protein n=1 Tax=Tulasnella calospora MUT 4182 TaxID=1051891 RepID=A0A0C3QK04_9AGAM|nr:hypothetical protein M407DRAFT_232670 [Tulasnella calospora MUT 4182]